MTSRRSSLPPSPEVAAVPNTHDNETFEEHQECGRRLRERAAALALTSDELNTLIAYLAGAGPDVLGLALDLIEQDRAGGGRRA